MSLAITPNKSKKGGGGNTDNFSKVSCDKMLDT